MSAHASQFHEQSGSSLIVTDSHSMATALLQALARLGEAGPHDEVTSIDNAVDAARSHQSATRIFVALDAEPARSLAVVRSIREMTSAPIYVVGPREAGLILDAVHAGADSFIEDADPLEEHLSKALSRQKSNGKLASEGKIISVCSVRGGCGGSLISVNLAAAITRRLKRVALCDLDMQNGVCDALLNLKPKHSILDLQSCVERLDRGSVEMALAKHSSGIQLLSAPPQIGHRHDALGELCVRVIRSLKQMFPVVVIDLPRIQADFDAGQLLSMCDKIVLVTQLDFDSIRSARRLIDHLARCGVPSTRIHVVGNRVGQKNLLTAAHVEEALKCKLSHQFPDDSKTVNRSINCGSPFYLDATDCPLAKELDLLVDSLLGRREPVALPGGVESLLPDPSSSNYFDVLNQWGWWLVSRAQQTKAAT